MEETDPIDRNDVDSEPTRSPLAPAASPLMNGPSAPDPVETAMVDSAAPSGGDLNVTAATERPGSIGWGYKDLFYVVAFAVPALVVSIIACFTLFFALEYIVGLKVDFQEPAGKAVMLVTMQMMWWALIVAFVYVLATVKHRMDFGESMAWIPLTRPLSSGALYCGLGFLLACSVAAIASLLPVPTERPPLEELLGDPAALLLLAVFGVTVVPAVEELLFRGFFYKALERMHGPFVAILATSVVFSMIHGPQYGWHWQNLVLLFYVGAVFALIRAQTGSVVPAAFVHAGYNGTLLFGVLLAGETIEKV